MTDHKTSLEATSLIALDPIALYKRDKHLAEKAWNRLSLDEQVRAWALSSYEARLTLCDLAHHTRELVQAAPPQEVWLTIQSVGGSDAMTLLQYASPEQVQFCLDVECWSKDRWVSAATFEWVRLIAACGEDKIAEFFETVDEELLGLLMKRWICVYVRVGDEEIADAIAWPRPESPRTLDGSLYFQVDDAQVDQWFRPMLEWYGKRNPELFRHLLLQVTTMSGSEQEELAYQTRARRLSEYGFPEWDEAIAAYRRLAVNDFAAIPRRQGPRPSDDPTALLNFPLLLLHDTELLLQKALAGVTIDVREAAATELARLTNRVLMADGHHITLVHTQQALQKVIAYVNLGLEQLSQGDTARAIEVIHDYWLTGLFQIGFSLITELADEARTWLAQHPEAATADDDPTTDRAIARERLRAASWKWPKYYVGPHAPNGVLHRDFRTAQELASVHSAMT